MTIGDQVGEVSPISLTPIALIVFLLDARY